jgi:CheY-like chemotaxis protein
MAFNHPTVLVINDDPDISEGLKVLLEGRYDVELALDGSEALEKMRAGLRPCIILLDLMMPIMDGFEFREAQLRDPELAEIPVVVFSAVADLQEKADRLRAAAYLELPAADLDLLADFLEKHCLK